MASSDRSSDAKQPPRRGIFSSIRGVLVSAWSGIRHFFKPRLTLKYPDQKLDLEGPGYQFDAKAGVGRPGFKGRHLLLEDKCTGCQLCAIACDGIAVAIDMQPLDLKRPHNKKDIWPAVDYGRCVPPWTPITTVGGSKPISELKVGDLVLTHTGKFRRVTQLFQRTYTGRLYTFRTLGNTQPLTTTEDHPILVSDGNEISWRFAADISIPTFLTRPASRGSFDEDMAQVGHANHSRTGSSAALLLPRAPSPTILSPIVSISKEEVEDFVVMNLEVEEDHSYVAANQSVHNCVFCGLCVDPSTEVQTNPGLTPISQIHVGQMVLTHNGTYKPVTKVWDMKYTGPLYRIHVYGKPEPLVCTEDHKVLAVSRRRSNRKDGRLVRSVEPLQLTLPRELKTGDYLVNPIVKKKKDIEKYETDLPFGPGNRTKHLVLEATPELFRLIGYYIAEGSSNASAVYFSLHKKETAIIEDITSLSQKFFGKTPSLAKATGDGVCVVLCSVLAVRFFSQFGKGAPNKKITDWVFHAGNVKLVQLLKGIWLGDGCTVRQTRQKYINFRTSSKVLAFQEQSVLARLGIVGLIEQQDQRQRLRSYHVNVFGRWALRLAKLWSVDLDYHPSKFVDKFHLTDDYVYLPIRSIERIEVADYRVMDVTVEDVHTFAPQGLATSNCVDACPFDALVMTNEYELSAYDRASLKYTPEMLFVPPKPTGTYKVKIDPERGNAKHG